MKPYNSGYVGSILKSPIVKIFLSNYVKNGTYSAGLASAPLQITGFLREKWHL